MARRQVKKRTEEFKIASVLKAFVCCLLIGGVAVGYVLQGNENDKLRRQLSQLEATEQTLKELKVRRELELQEQKSEANLTNMARHFNLDAELGPARPGQVVSLEMYAPISPMIVLSDRPAPSRPTPARSAP